MTVECPGLYCGRIKYENGNLSSCTSCPTGFRSVASYPFTLDTIFPKPGPSECIPCNFELGIHEWLYLGFIVLFLLVLEFYVIDHSIRRRILPFKVLALHLSAFFEVSFASLFTLMSYSASSWPFDIKFCGVYRLSDWYTLFFNPNYNYKETLRCTQEAVYPLNSMVFLFFLFALLNLLIIRSWIVHKISDKNACDTIYLTLYIIPALAFCHAVFSGLIYYSFPYITLIGSIISIACHFAYRLDQSMKALILNSFENVRSTLIILGHWLLHAYGIISLTKLKSPLHYSLLILVPLPSLFYILTSRFTDPRLIN